MELWIVGLWHDTSWTIEGVYDSEDKAVLACKTDMYFIGPATLNEPLPAGVVFWPGSYYPLAKNV